MGWICRDGFIWNQDFTTSAIVSFNAVHTLEVIFVSGGRAFLNQSTTDTTARSRPQRAKLLYPPELLSYYTEFPNSSRLPPIF
jgi:hypothetical protein